MDYEGLMTAAQMVRDFRTRYRYDVSERESRAMLATVTTLERIANATRVKMRDER